MLTTQPRSSLLAYSQRVCWSTGRPGRERGPVGPDPAVSTGGLCGSLRQPTCAVERSSASGWTRGRVPARLTWPAKPCALPWALSWVLPWVLPWALLWALPWALPRSAVGQQSVSSRSAARRWPAGRRWQTRGARAMDVVAELCCLCTLPAVTLPAPWPRLSCLCAFHGRPSGARPSVISFVCQDSKFLSGLSSFCQDSQVCLSGLSSLRQDCPIRTIPQRARTVERGAGRLSFTAGGEGKEGCSEGRWRSRRRHL